MKQKSITVQTMMKNFMELHNNGKSISEIAKICNVSTWTIYTNLQSIADANEVTRDSLLERVHKKHELVNARSLTRYPELDITDLLENFDTINTSINNILDTISIVLDSE